MKEGCCEVSWLFAYRIPERSWWVNLCPLQQQWLQPPPKATSPVVEKSEPLQAIYCYFYYITMKSLALTPNLHVTLIHLGHGGQLFSLQQLFMYLKIVTRISTFLLHFHYISIMLNSSTLFSIFLQALCPGSMIAYISTYFSHTFATFCSRV